MSRNKQIVQRIKEICASVGPMPDDASYVHEAMMRVFHAEGFQVFHEYPVKFNGGKNGRIDIVLKSSCGDVIAIEIDARRPRRKSVDKLSTSDWVKICCLRGVSEGDDEYPGLDAVIPLPVRLKSFSEAKVKASVRNTGMKLRGLQ